MYAERELLLAEGVNVPDIPFIDDQISTFSCHNGRYSEVSGEVIVYKVERHTDDETIHSDDGSEFSDSQATTTDQIYSTKSTITTTTSRTVPYATSTIGVNLGHEGNNYDILLRRQDESPLSTRQSHNIQSGRSLF